MKIDTAGITYYVVSERNRNAAVAGFMLHKDALSFARLLNAREGQHSPLYMIVSDDSVIDRVTA